MLQEGEIAAWRMQFNTGREYTPQGQEIEAKICSWQFCAISGKDTYNLAFIDRSRGVCGVVQVGAVRPEALMQEYDAGRYKGHWTGGYELLGFFGRV